MYMISVNNDQIISFVLEQVECGRIYDHIKKEIKEKFNIYLPIHYINKIEIFGHKANLKNLTRFNQCIIEKPKKIMKKSIPKKIVHSTKRPRKKISKHINRFNTKRSPKFSPLVFSMFENQAFYGDIIEEVRNRFNTNISAYRLEKIKLYIFDYSLHKKFITLTNRRKEKSEKRRNLTIRKIKLAREKLRSYNITAPQEEKEMIITEKDISNPLKPKKMTKIEKSFFCSEQGCNGELIVNYRRGERICRLCGAVYHNNIIDTGPDWRLYESGKNNKIRIGSPPSMLDYDKGLSTDFNPKKGDGRGTPLSATNRANFVRWRKWNNRNKLSDSDYRNYSTAFNELRKICSQLQFEKSIKEAIAMLYRKLRKRGVTNGCKINGMVVACIIAICRLRKIPITPQEVIEFSQVKNMKEVRTSYNIIREVMDIPSIDGSDYLARFVNELNLPSIVEEKARKLVDLVEKTGFLIGKNPFGITAACLWIVNKKFGSQKNKSMREFANVCNITEVTARQRKDEILDQFNIIIS